MATKKQEEKKDWTTVFDAHPKVNAIYVVDGQPFLTEKEAGNHARTTGKEIEKVSRSKAKGAAETK